MIIIFFFFDKENKLLFMMENRLWYDVEHDIQLKNSKSTS